jgi:hypothetical protein
MYIKQQPNGGSLLWEVLPELPVLQEATSLVVVILHLPTPMGLLWIVSPKQKQIS